MNGLFLEQSLLTLKTCLFALRRLLLAHLVVQFEENTSPESTLILESVRIAEKSIIEFHFG